MKYLSVFLLLVTNVHALPQYFDKVEPAQVEAVVVSEILPSLGADIGLDVNLYCQRAAQIQSQIQNQTQEPIQDATQEPTQEPSQNETISVRRVSYNGETGIGACELVGGPLYEPATPVIHARFANDVYPVSFRGVSYHSATVYQYCDSQLKTVSNSTYSLAPEAVTLGISSTTIQCYSPDTALRPQWFYFNVNIEGVSAFDCASGTLLNEACFVGLDERTLPFEVVTNVIPPSVTCPDDYPELDETASFCTVAGAAHQSYIEQQLQSDKTEGAFKHLPLAITAFVATGSLGFGVYQLAQRVRR